jgi:hypothetical protein
MARAMATERADAPVECLLELAWLWKKTGTVRLIVPRRGQDTTVVLPIQSVDNELLDALTAPLRPKAPLVHAFAHGPRHRGRVDVDLAHEDAVEVYNMTYALVTVLCGVAVDLADEHDRVVWSADNSMHELDATRQVLQRMGMTTAQVLTLLQAIHTLTAQEPEPLGSAPSNGEPPPYVPPNHYWPAQYHGHIETPPRFLYHYLNVAGKSCPVPKSLEKQWIPRSHGFRDPQVARVGRATSQLRIHALISRRGDIHLHNVFGSPGG